MKPLFPQRSLLKPRYSLLEQRFFDVLRILGILALTGVWLIFTKAFVVQFFQLDVIAQRRTAAGIPEIRALYALSILIVACLGFLRGREILQKVKHLPWILGLFMLYVTLSVFWSLNPRESLMKVILFHTSTAAGLLLSVFFPTPRDLERWLMSILLFLISASIFWVTFLPEYGAYMDFRGTHWIGVFNYKNVLGYISAVAFILALSAKEGGGWVIVRVFLGIFSLTTLIFSHAAGAQVFTLTTLLAWPVWRFLQRARLRILLGVGSFLVIVGILAAAWVWTHLPIVLSALGREATLSKRIPLWGTILWTLQHYGRLWIGAGQEAFFGGWASVTTRWVWRIVGWRPMQAHSGYVQVIADLGLLGLVLAVGLLVILLFRLLRAYRRDPTWEFLVLFFTFFLQMNVTESLFTAASVYATMAFWSILVWIAVTSPFSLSHRHP